MRVNIHVKYKNEICEFYALEASNIGCSASKSIITKFVAAIVWILPIKKPSK
ncbi:hypothetical protein [Paraphotobacterium marinum]|uniref:hypothetical protein n=1 Tax=Paraphotobacterium marinum TaxID=1755811 RepID=UPI001313F32B|nr:hypothetical protein [Paraphotobacterium marinum]